MSIETRTSTLYKLKITEQVKKKKKKTKKKKKKTNPHHYNLHNTDDVTQ